MDKKNDNINLNNINNNTKNNKDLIKIISKHISYLENDVSVYENIFNNIEENKLSEDTIDDIKIMDTGRKTIAENIENCYFYYFKSIQEDFDKLNFVFLYENERVKNKLKNSYTAINNYKYQIDLTNNEINNVVKQKKLLEEKVSFIT
jgi:hypothetical protein